MSTQTIRQGIEHVRERGRLIDALEKRGADDVTYKLDFPKPEAQFAVRCDSRKEQLGSASFYFVGRNLTEPQKSNFGALVDALTNRINNLNKTEDRQKLETLIVRFCRQHRLQLSEDFSTRTLTMRDGIPPRQLRLIRLSQLGRPQGVQ